LNPPEPRDQSTRTGASSSSGRFAQRQVASIPEVPALAHLPRSVPRDLSKFVQAESATLLRANVLEHEATMDALRVEAPTVHAT
jgi:hypothetical protein